MSFHTSPGATTRLGRLSSPRVGKRIGVHKAVSEARFVTLSRASQASLRVRRQGDKTTRCLAGSCWPLWRPGCPRQKAAARSSGADGRVGEERAVGLLACFLLPVLDMASLAEAWEHTRRESIRRRQEGRRAGAGVLVCRNPGRIWNMESGHVSKLKRRAYALVLAVERVETAVEGNARAGVGVWAWGAHCIGPKGASGLAPLQCATQQRAATLERKERVCPPLPRGRWIGLGSCTLFLARALLSEGESGPRAVNGGRRV
ncbi:hypothetical protein BDV95DRAFT_633309 [Massariosphaeria phaeospora]|uniref:Uncharacterized protein n=1 Tax=Massariosphaeria phaeospora TaxID=100035 RepID=A0A7C8IF85_9PLEO|nr:hypothetical protein BDV95DRAFT_633309 [Massariosphaeria phaeospora]